MAKSISSKLSTESKFGRLRPLSWVRDAHTSGGKKKPVWAFLCDCGPVIETRAYSVTSSKTKSCGCLLPDATREAHTRHGAATAGAHTPEYKAWRNMLTRGRNPNIVNAEHYVHRGIAVCDEWLPGGDGKGFERFLDHVGAKPPHTSLDRIDNNKGYAPGNVRWATGRQQALNKSCTLMFIDANGVRTPVSEICRIKGIAPSLVYDRIRLGWPQERWFEPKRRGAS